MGIFNPGHNNKAYNKGIPCALIPRMIFVIVVAVSCEEGRLHVLLL